MLPQQSVPGFTFRVQLLDSLGATVDEGSFEEATGLPAKMDTENIQEGGTNRFVHRLPTGVKNQLLKLSRGMLVTGRPLATWCYSVLQGDFAAPTQPQTLVLQLLDGTTLMKAWTLYGVWPTHWEIDGSGSTAGKIVVETLEFGYGHFEPIRTQ